MRSVQHACVRHQGIIPGVSAIAFRDVSDDPLEFRTIILVLTQEIERLLLSENFAAQVGVSADTVFYAHTKSTEHNRDDPVTSAPSISRISSSLSAHTLQCSCQT